MVRLARTTALLVAVTVVVSLSGCASVLDDGGPGATGPPGTALETPTDRPADTTVPVSSSEREISTTDRTNETERSDETDRPTAATTTQRVTSPTATSDESTATPDEPTASFVESETLATVSLEIADSPTERRRGLMNRESLAADHGMVFVYDDADQRSFWMKNTLVPLDMVFVSPNGTVLNVEHAAPQPNASDSELRLYRSAGAAQYVVEVNRGFANRTGVEAGTAVEFSGLNRTDE